MKQKLFVSFGMLLAVALAMVMAFHEWQPGKRAGVSVAAVRVHGEPIQTAALPVPVAEALTNHSPKRKHPQPPSTQRRMVMAWLAERDDTNADTLSMVSGTKGTGVDLARTYLPSVTSLAGPEANLPGYRNLSFATLSGFEFTLTKEMADGTVDPVAAAAKVQALIPSDIQSLDGQKAVISGFLLPVKMNNGLAVEFLLLRNQSMCCYGVAPKVNEWISVRMQSGGVKPVMDQPLTVAGTLHVAPMQENGLLSGIYSLDGEKSLADSVSFIR